MLVLDRPVPDGFDELLELRFKFPFNLIGKSTVAFLTGQSISWRVLKSWYTGGGPEQGFRRCFADGLHQKLSSVCDAGYLIIGAAGPGNFSRCSPQNANHVIEHCPIISVPNSVLWLNTLCSSTCSLAPTSLFDHSSHARRP